MLSPFVGGEIDPNRSGRLGGDISGVGRPDPPAFAEFDRRPAPAGSARLCPGGNPGFVPTHHQPPSQGDVCSRIIDQTTAGNGNLLSFGAGVFGDPAGRPGDDTIARELRAPLFIQNIRTKRKNSRSLLSILDTSINSPLLRMTPALLIIAKERMGLPSLPCKYKNQ